MKLWFGRLATVAGAGAAAICLVLTSPTAALASGRSELGVSTEAAAIAGTTVCASAHVRNDGWSSLQCVGEGAVLVAGTTGQNKAMEALRLQVFGTSFCLDAHVQNIGWQGGVCGESGALLERGTTGQVLHLEAVAVSAPDRIVCLDAHVQNIGWMGSHCSSNYNETVYAGTTGQGLQMEALLIYMYP